MIRDLPRGRLRRVEEFLPVEERIEPALAGDEPDGDIDFIPTEEYTAGDADRAYAEAAWIVELAGEVITRLPS